MEEGVFFLPDLNSLKAGQRNRLKSGSLKLKSLIGSDVCYSYGKPYPSDVFMRSYLESRGSGPSNSNSSLLIVSMQQSFLDFQKLLFDFCPLCACICIYTLYV